MIIAANAICNIVFVGAVAACVAVAWRMRAAPLPVSAPASPEETILPTPSPMAVFGELNVAGGGDGQSPELNHPEEIELVERPTLRRSSRPSVRVLRYGSAENV